MATTNEPGGGSIITDIIIPCIPVVGLITGLVFGLIDLNYAWSREQGKRRILSAFISHAAYAAIFLLVL